jgi:CheY-like chemotaxis protein
MSKIMLVEDDNNLREIYEARLQAEGYQIVAAKDGEEALVVAKAEKPDLVISDIMMPKISGFEMLDILRNTDGLKDLKVIMLTALGQNDDQQKADRLGADRYLVKSQVTLEDIVKVTHELLGDAPAPEPVTVTPAPATPTPAPTSAAVLLAPAPVAPPEVQPEPTASTAAAPIPIPDPAPVIPAPNPPAPQLIAVPDPPVTTATATAGGAQSTDQEEATVESQVEDFVAGATEQPASPAELVQSATDAQPATAPLVTPTAAANTTAPGTEVQPTNPAIALADDKLVTDAAQSLADSTGSDTAQAQVEPAKSPSDARTKRIIQPIDTSPKKDINALLAAEEAKQPPPAPQPVIVADDPKSATSQAPPNPVVTPPATAAEAEPAIVPAAQMPLPETEATPDPNSIAL